MNGYNSYVFNIDNMLLNIMEYFRKEKANAIVNALKTQDVHRQKMDLVPKLPDIDDTFIPIKIAQVRFYLLTLILFLLCS